MHYRGTIGGYEVVVEKSVKEGTKGFRNVIADMLVRVIVMKAEGSKTRVREYFVVDFGGYGMTESM
jgi:hypothetical protein